MAREHFESFEKQRENVRLRFESVSACGSRGDKDQEVQDAHTTGIVAVGIPLKVLAAAVLEPGSVLRLIFACDLSPHAKPSLGTPLTPCFLVSNPDLRGAIT